MKRTLATLRYLLSTHLLALVILSIFRIILYVANSDQVNGLDDKFGLLTIAFLKGLQFDNMVACYIIALPAVVLLILSLLDRTPKSVIRGFNIYFIVAYSIIFGISAADIPYFSYYYTHLGGSILNWLGFGSTLGMILGEPSYYIYITLFLLFIITFGYLVFQFGNKLLRTKIECPKVSDYKYLIPMVVVVWGVCFIGLRGRFGRYPLRVSGAYFCDNSFVNQLGLNPSFFLLKSSSSYMKQKDKLQGVMTEEEAITYVQKALHIAPEDEDYPVTRRVITGGEAKNANIVVILMESMSSGFLDIEYNGKALTPYLHELIGKSYYFENFFSSGIHTNNGIASTLYGFPPIFDRTMMAVSPDLYTGLPFTLRDGGYQTLFFLTHDPQYDNMYSFLSDNGFNRIHSQYDYPKEKVVNNFGVQDDFLFQYGVKQLNEESKSGKPFLATFMTVSNHPPYIVPYKFRNTGSSDEERIVAFTDHSIKEFMEEAAKQDWYNNTIFLFLGDHGKTMGQQLYNISIPYVHVPLIIYSPLFEDTPKLLKQYGGQIDIFPTVMGLLNRSYKNNSLGIDLFKEERPFMYMVTDTQLGCINDQFFYTYDPESKMDGLYEYRTNSSTNLKEKYISTADSMKNYATSMMVTANYLVKNKLTRPGLKR